MTAERFDIDRVQLRHYRSIKKCDVKLGPFTAIVGPNGSGKSNFVDALRFVAQAINESLDHALRERGGVTEARRRSMGHPNHFEIQLHCHTSTFEATYGFTVGSRPGGEFAVTREHCKIQTAEFGSPTHEFRVRNGEVETSTLDTLPRVLQDGLTLIPLSGNPTFRPLVDGLTGTNVFNLNPEQMRVPQKPDPGEFLRRDGSNVASVVERARRNFPKELGQVQDYLRTIVPDIEAVERRAIGAFETLELKQRVAGAERPWTFPASSMSDGTLRALGILVALFAADPGSPSPVVVEEPETALHPAAAGALLEALLDASRHRQVLVTSHSPELLDSPDLGPEHILAVRSQAGTTSIKRIDQGGQDALKENLFTAGELLRADQLIPDYSGSVQLPLLP